jgi:hypothetical protein
MAYKITENEFTQFWPGACSISWVSRYTLMNQPISSMLDATGTIWTLTFGSAGSGTTFVIEQGNNSIIVDGSSTWHRMP